MLRNLRIRIETRGTHWTTHLFYPFGHPIHILFDFNFEKTQMILTKYRHFARHPPVESPRMDVLYRFVVLGVPAEMSKAEVDGAMFGDRDDVVWGAF